MSHNPTVGSEGDWATKFIESWIPIHVKDAQHVKEAKIEARKEFESHYSKKLHEAEVRAKVTGETSDGYHTFNELYDYRRVYNAVLFNEWARNGAYQVHKSWKHSDGEDCFGGGWFIVMAQLPTGQISNHYEAKHWDEFDVPEEPLAAEWDGHTPQQALERLEDLSKERGDNE